jgi:hypothetical protein
MNVIMKIPLPIFSHVRACARSFSNTFFFSLSDFFLFERKDSEKHFTFWPDQKKKDSEPACTSAKEGKHVGRRVCGVEKEEEEKQEG